MVCPCPIKTLDGSGGGPEEVLGAPRWCEVIKVRAKKQPLSNTCT